MMKSSFTNQEIYERLKNLGDVLEKKKREADKLLRDIETICKEILSLQENINKEKNE